MITGYTHSNETIDKGREIEKKRAKKKKLAAAKERYTPESNRRQISFTLSKNLKNDFLVYCQKNMLNKSLVIEQMIRDLMNKVQLEEALKPKDQNPDHPNQR